jgi:Protein of unknown function (DUF2917)
MNLTRFWPFVNAMVSSNLQIHVKPQAASRFKAARKSRLLVCQGAVWVTRQHDSTDYFLQEGQSLQVRAGDLLVLENLSSVTGISRVCIYERPD